MNYLLIKIKKSQVLMIKYNGNYIVIKTFFIVHYPQKISSCLKSAFNSIIRFNEIFKYCKAILNISTPLSTQDMVFSACKSKLDISIYKRLKHYEDLKIRIEFDDLLLY